MPGSPPEIDSGSGLSFVHPMSLGAPAQHAAGEVGDLGEACPLQKDRSLRRAGA
jgi:hypothetical protein